MFVQCVVTRQFVQCEVTRRFVQCQVTGNRAVCIVSGSKVSDTVPGDKEVCIVKVPEDKGCLYSQVKFSQQTLITPHSAR